MEVVRRLVAAGIPVMGHVGLLPQSVHAVGGFRVQGRDAEAQKRVVAEARGLEEAGAFAIVLEAIPRSLASVVTGEVTVPTIGIGAGPECDGQVLVCYDLLGLFQGFVPKFVKRYAQFGDGAVEAARSYVADVRSGEFPSVEHSFGGPVAKDAVGDSAGALGGALSDSPEEARYGAGGSRATDVGSRGEGIAEGEGGRD